MPNDDYIDSPLNIFSDDYMSDGLFGEEDEEIGSDFHEIGLGDPQKAAQDSAKYARGEHAEIGDAENITSLKALKKVKGKLPKRMVAKGITRAFIVKGDKLFILIP